MLELFDRIVEPDLTIRRVNLVACNLLPENQIPDEKPIQLDLFTDYEALEREKKERQTAEERERRLQKATLALQDRYGKNVILKGMNFLEGATTRERNAQIGGHRAGEDSFFPSSLSAETNEDQPEDAEEGDWDG